PLAQETFDALTVDQDGLHHSNRRVQRSAFLLVAMPRSCTNRQPKRGMSPSGLGGRKETSTSPTSRGGAPTREFQHLLHEETCKHPRNSAAAAGASAARAGVARAGPLHLHAALYAVQGVDAGAG